MSKLMLIDEVPGERIGYDKPLPNGCWLCIGCGVILSPKRDWNQCSDCDTRTTRGLLMSLSELRGLDNLEQRGDGSWWERWTDEDGEEHWQRIGWTDDALRWLEFWRIVR